MRGISVEFVVEDIMENLSPVSVRFVSVNPANVDLRNTGQREEGQRERRQREGLIKRKHHLKRRNHKAEIEWSFSGT